LLKEQRNISFSIFAVPYIAIVTVADCTTPTVAAIGVLMAAVSVAWNIFCEDIGQNIHLHDTNFSNRALVIYTNKIHWTFHSASKF